MPREGATGFFRRRKSGSHTTSSPSQNRRPPPRTRFFASMLPSSAAATTLLSSSSSSSLATRSRGMGGGPQQQQQNAQPWTPEAVASLPPPGLAGPSQLQFSPLPPPLPSQQQSSFSSHSSNNNNRNSTREKPKRYLAYVSSPSTMHHHAARSSASGGGTTSGGPRGPQTQSIYPPLTTGADSPHRHSATAQWHHHQHRHSATTSTNASTSTSSSSERQLMYLDLTDLDQRPLPPPAPLLQVSRTDKRRLTAADSTVSGGDSEGGGSDRVSLEERLRRERQRLSASSRSLTQFAWQWTTTSAPSSSSSPTTHDHLRILVPARGSLYVQEGVGTPTTATATAATAPSRPRRTGRTPPPQGQAPSPHIITTTVLRCIHDKSQHKLAAVDAQLSPDGHLVAWTAQGEVYVHAVGGPTGVSPPPTSPADMDGLSQQGRPVQITFGARQSVTTFVSHGIADFVAQEEMDRYRGFWWHPQSHGILLARVDESQVPPYRIVHPAAQPAAVETAFEDHRYPFAGHENPKVQLIYVPIDRSSLLAASSSPYNDDDDDDMEMDQKDDDNYRITDDSGFMQRDDDDDDASDRAHDSAAQRVARRQWETSCVWFTPPREASEYLARVYWLPDGTSAVVQWQNRAQNVLVLQRLDIQTGKGRTLLVERSQTWINLHHMFYFLPAPVHPDDCGHHQPGPPLPQPLPEGSFSFLFASERCGYSHLYLYTYCPGINGEQAVLIRAVSSGNWMVESIAGVDVEHDLVYLTGTYDSPLERHLYAMPLTCCRLLGRGGQGAGTAAASSLDPSTAVAAPSVEEPNGMRRGLSKVMNALSGKSGAKKAEEVPHQNSSLSYHPYRLTELSGMHSIVMDDKCEVVVDTSSDLDRPTSVRIYKVVHQANGEYRATHLQHLYTLFDALNEETANGGKKIGPSATRKLYASLPAPELISFPTSDGSETLHAAVYKPDPRVYGNGPYPLICAVYGGPHVQRVNRSWSQCADMRAQRFRSLGFCVVKCDNRGSSRRGLSFESSIARRLGRLEVLDQVAAVRQLTVRGIADAARVGIYGWSYGGYLSAMCLCRAPDVFSCAVAGAPVTSWDAYDTHYTERYMGLPADNPAGYREAAIFDHVPNMRGKLMIVHGLIDENVHFRHTARLINRLVSCGKDYELLLFPEERHSPRRLRDRIYMEQRIGDFFVRYLAESPTALDLVSALGPAGLRNLAGRL